MNRTTPKEQMLSGPVGRTLFSMSAPMILAAMTVALSNLIDVVFLGRTLGVLAVSGLAVVFPLQLLFLGLGQGIASGGSSIISRALGADDTPLARKTFAHIVFLVLFFSLVFFLSAIGFLPRILMAFGASEAILKVVIHFAQITIFGYFLYGLSLALNSVIRAEGYAIPSLVSRIMTVVAKVTFTWLFVVELRWGMTGAALASVLSHFLAVTYLTVEFFRHRSVLLFKRGDLSLDLSLIGRILSLSTSVFITYFAGTITAIIINHLITATGSMVSLAIYGVIHRIRVFLYTPILGLNQGLQPFVGFNLGSGKIQRIKTAVKIATFTSFVIMILLTLVIQLAPGTIMSFFAEGAKYEKAGDVALQTATFMVALSTLPIITGTMALSLGHAFLASLIALSRQVLFFVPMAVLLTSLWGVKGVWWAYIFSDLLSFVMGLIILRILMGKLTTASQQSAPQNTP